MKKIKLVKYLFQVFYTATVLYIVFFARRRWGLHEQYFNIVPLNILREFINLKSSGNREVYNFYSNVIGNIILFLPFSLLFQSERKYVSLGTIILLAFISSMTIETLQFMLRIGVADVDDVLLNTFGTAIGIVLIKTLRITFWSKSELLNSSV
jgi:glycopeptide antibiotics resistance protein